MNSQAHIPSPMLYIVGTPIGNMGDITLRALEVLKAVDIIFCEDTRVTQQLLKKYNIKKSLFSYHDHNEKNQVLKIKNYLENSQSVALISDAGMPLISDPGYKLIENCRLTHTPYTVIPGPSASLTALILSGLPTHAFYFAGFIPQKKKTLETFFNETIHLTATLIFYESAKRLSKTLRILKNHYGNRRASVVREMTKKFEESRHGRLEVLEGFYKNSPPKGEIVIVVEGATESTQRSICSEDIIRDLLQAFSVKDTASLLSRLLHFPKNDLYAECLRVKNDSPKK